MITAATVNLQRAGYGSIKYNLTHGYVVGSGAASGQAALNELWASGHLVRSCDSHHTRPFFGENLISFTN